MALTDVGAPPPDTVVIGIGNPLRGDDGAGPAVVAALPPSPHVRCLDVHQLLPELADDIARAQRVIFVDASMTAAEVTVKPVEPGTGTVDGHLLSPATLLGLCRDAYGAVPAKAWLVEVPATAFDHGSGLSRMTRHAVVEATGRVREMLDDGPKA